MAKELSNAHKALGNMMNMTDPRSYAVYKFIDEVYPAFAEKIFKNNSFMERLVMSNYNPIDILDYPICGRCETLAAWDGIGRKDGKVYKACSCFNCGSKTVNPVTFRVWMREELKHKAPLNFKEIAEEITDQAVIGMLRVAQRQVDDALVERFKHLNPKMGQEEETEISHEYMPKTNVQVNEKKLSKTYEEMVENTDGDDIEVLPDNAQDVYMKEDEDV